MTFLQAGLSNNFIRSHPETETVGVGIEFTEVPAPKV